MIKNRFKIITIYISIILIVTSMFGISIVGIEIWNDNSNDSQYPIFQIPNLKVVSIPITHLSELGELISKGLDIIDFKDLKATAYVNDFELNWLNEHGFQPIVLYSSLKNMIDQMYSNESILQFHSYSEMTAELEEIADNYANITKLYNLGSSVQDRTIWGLEITDNPNIEENEPEVRICGAHHGNELMSVELPLLLAWYLVENYENNPYIRNLVNNREIWIIPMVNPDGREATSRYNANGVDLNRDYGYMWVGEGNSPAPFSQPETQSIRDHALDNNFVLSLSFHTSGDIVNYIWNYKGEPVADNEVVVLLSEQYGSHNGYWVVEGYDWYQTRGDTNDFSYGCRGDIDWTIETQNYDIDEAWNLNREAMIEIIDAANMGLSGIVTNELTGEPIAATVWVEEVYWPCFTDPQIGDYHRVLLPGTYTIHFQANGFEEKVYTIQIQANGLYNLNVSLSPDNEYYAYQVTLCNYYDPYSYPNNFQNNPTEAISALGYPDNICASLGNGGLILLDMGEGTEIFDLSGEPDFKIFEGDETIDGYKVYVSNEWNGPWSYLGLATGTSDFDLADVSIESARYVRIEDDADSNPYDDNPGVDIDAIENLAAKNYNNPPNQPNTPTGPSIGLTGIEYNFSICTTDPENNPLYYMFSWDDKSYSEWLGPYESGTTCEVLHSFAEPGEYNVKVKATDTYSQSNWSEPLIITITEGPIFEISSIKGGLFKVSSKIKNTGAINVENLKWKIIVDGNVFIGKETSGTDSIAMGKEISVTSKFILGFGPTHVIVEAWIPEGHSDTRRLGGFVYIFFIYVNPGG